jgi:hypothetical protein
LKNLNKKSTQTKEKTSSRRISFLLSFFCAAEVTTNKLFAINVSLAKTAWILGKQTDKNIIIPDLCVLYCNRVADGSWSQVSSADSKIIALTTQIKNLQDKLSNTCPGKGKPSGKGKPAATVTHNKKDKEPGNKWRYTKVGETTTNPTTGYGARVGCENILCGYLYDGDLAFVILKGNLQF